MKIITPGRSQAGWAREHSCTGSGNGGDGCGATLLVEAADVYETLRSDYGGGRDSYTTFACASCNVETDIKDCPVFPLPTRTGWLKARALAALRVEGSGDRG